MISEEQLLLPVSAQIISVIIMGSNKDKSPKIPPEL